MKTVNQVAEIVSKCTFPGWSISPYWNEKEIFLQVVCKDGIDNVTGERYNWRGRKWRLSLHMTESEIVKTALKAVLAAAEHETLEKFKYDGVSIFDPHIDVKDLLELRRSKELDGR